MCENPIRAENPLSSMTDDGHQSQELLVPASPAPQEEQGASSPPGEDAEGAGQGPVNAITVLTLLDKLVNMLDAVQENQHKMEVHQAEMEVVVRGIQADMTKMSKTHTHTANSVSKLLDKSRKVSVTMKEVRENMERQGVQVKKLEVNHAHLLNRNNFKVLIFQEEQEIPSSVFVKEPVPFPRDEGEEPDTNRSQEEGLHTIDLSSDEDVGLEAELEDEGEGLYHLEHMDKSRADKLKRSSLKKVDSLKRSLEKKMDRWSLTQEQRDKIKKSLTPPQTSFKMPPLGFSLRRKSSESRAAEPQAAPQPGDSPGALAQVELSQLGSAEHELLFTQVHSQLAPGPPEETGEEEGGNEERGDEENGEKEKGEEGGEKEKGEERGEKEKGEEQVSEGLSEKYSLSETLPHGGSPAALGEEVLP